MQNLKKLLLLLAIWPCFTMAQNAMQTNILLVHSNQPIKFNKVNAAVIKDAVSAVVKVSDKRVKALITIPAAKQTVANMLMGIDELEYDLNDLGNKLGIIASTYADDSTRNEANSQVQVLAQYNSDLFLNEPLYHAIKTFSLSNTAKGLSAPQKKFLNETIIAFEINGMKLDAGGKAALKITNQKLIYWGNRFDTNLAEAKDSIEFTADDLKGVNEAAIKPWKRPNGKYMIRITGPNAIEIAEHAAIEATRRAMYLKYNNRAYPKNITALDSLFHYRQQLADELGYKTYAQYALVTKMAAAPANVWHFLDDLQTKLSAGVGPDVAQLTALKQAQHPGVKDTLQAWDFTYYNKMLLDTKYKLNTDELKPYFEMNNTIQGMFLVYQKLFNITIRETKGVPAWDAKIKSYELWMDGKKMGTFFLDLYPRPNKYTHFETAPISQYRIAGGKEILPVGTLICNFPEGTSTEPSLLDHYDVITMFHEFGHLIHFLLCHPVIASQNSFSTKGDFVEAPSQFLENFCWNYNCLKLFARNYKTGEVLPKALFDKMKRTQNVNVSSLSIRQVMYAKIDFTYEDRYNSIKNEDINNVSVNLFKMTQLPYPYGSHFICGFTHLNGYGANYYGYLWSLVYAKDIFSVFEKNGVLSTATGIRYRKDILEKGATEEEMAMLKNFLGREPNSKAFLKSLGIN